VKSILIAALLLPCAPLAVLAGDKEARRTELDEVVDRGLMFLQRQQEKDGSWVGGKSGGKHPAVAALAVMAFLSAGHVPGEGKYGETIEKGVRWVMKQQHDDGLIASDAAHEMYHHGICTLMLVEVAGMTDGTLGAEVRERLRKAIAIIIKAQRDKSTGKQEGGWRYHVDQRKDNNSSDISVTGWQILSLRGAKDLGCDVPPEVIDRAIEFVKRCQDKNSGGFNYQPESRLTTACTGTSILCLELCNKEKGHVPETEKAGSYVVDHVPVWGGGEGHFFYSIYYCSQAAFQLGDNYWDHFRPKLHRTLFDHQAKDNGGWFGGDNESQTYGPSYGTAMAILALTVEYRYLPIYQRSEEPPKTEKK
jgi:hypothetical protein